MERTTKNKINLNNKGRTSNITIASQPSSLYFIFKRFCDIAISLTGIIFLMPVFLFLATSIKLIDGGSVFYLRESVGYRGRHFYSIKFRTMIPNAEDYLTNHPELLLISQQYRKIESDPRITRVGEFLRKTDLDKLPQLFNVLIGQMSIVGPGMIHPSELPNYGEYAQKRLSVKPGFTGLGPLDRREQITTKELVLLDMQYIDTRSYILDLGIIVKSLIAFVIHPTTRR